MMHGQKNIKLLYTHWQHME